MLDAAFSSLQRVTPLAASCGTESEETLRDGVRERLYHAQRRELAQLRAETPEAASRVRDLEAKLAAAEAAIAAQQSAVDTLRAEREKATLDLEHELKNAQLLDEQREKQTLLFGNLLASEEAMSCRLKKTARARDDLARRIGSLEDAVRHHRNDASNKAAVVARLEARIRQATAQSMLASQACRRAAALRCQRHEREKARLLDALQDTEARCDTLAARCEDLRMAQQEQRAAAASALSMSMQRDGRGNGASAPPADDAAAASLADAVARAVAAEAESSRLRHQLSRKEEALRASEQAQAQAAHTLPPSDAQLESQIACLYGSLRSIFDVARASAHHQRNADSSHVQVRTLERQLEQTRAMQVQSGVVSDC